MSQTKFTNPRERRFTVVLIHAEENPLAVIDDASLANHRTQAIERRGG